MIPRIRYNNVPRAPRSHSNSITYAQPRQFYTQNHYQQQRVPYRPQDPLKRAIPNDFIPSINKTTKNLLPLTSQPSYAKTNLQTFQNLKGIENSSQRRVLRHQKQKKARDNVSCYSKFSTKTHKLLRPISINNDEHLYQLKDKTEKLKNKNQGLVDAFLKNIDYKKKAVLSNVESKFVHRINTIWDSYQRQKINQQNSRLDSLQLRHSVGQINSVFKSKIVAQTDEYIE